MDSFNIQQGPTAPEVKKLKWKPAGALLVSEKKRKLLRLMEWRMERPLELVRFRSMPILLYMTQREEWVSFCVSTIGDSLTHPLVPMTKQTT
jgi:hypothetical protein